MIWSCLSLVWVIDIQRQSKTLNYISNIKCVFAYVCTQDGTTSLLQVISRVKYDLGLVYFSEIIYSSDLWPLKSSWTFGCGKNSLLVQQITCNSSWEIRLLAAQQKNSFPKAKSCLLVFAKLMTGMIYQLTSTSLRFLWLLPSVDQHHWYWPWQYLAAGAVVPTEPAWYCRCDPGWRPGNTETNRSAGPQGRPRTAQPGQGWIWQQGGEDSRDLRCVLL